MKKQNIKHILNEVGVIIHDVHGNSMNPLLYDGDRVEIKKQDEYSLFDVILFQQEKNKYVLHRIININNDNYDIIGDNSFYIDKKHKKDILGKMIGYYHNDIHHSLEDDEYKKYLDSFIYSNEETRKLLLSNTSDFFYQRQKKGYYELIKLALLDQCDSNYFTALTPNELIRLSNYLKNKKALHLLGLLINKYHIDLGEDINKRCLNQYNLEIFNYDRSERMINELSNVFDKYNINHSYIKGAELRNRYIYPYTRVSRDIDVLVSKDDFTKAKEATIKELNANYWATSGHDECFTLEDSKTKVELHHTISSRLPSEVSYILDDALSKGYIDDKHPSRIHIHDDINLIYILSHSVVHLKLGYFWSSFFFDIYLLSKNNVNLELLKQSKLDKYYFTMKAILDHILFDKPLSNEESQFEDFLFNASYDLSFSMEVSKDSKALYILKRIWMPYNLLAENSSKLQKYPILLPLYQLRRWGRLIFSKKRKQEVKKELNQPNSNKLLLSVGLKEFINLKIW